MWGRLTPLCYCLCDSDSFFKKEHFALGRSELFGVNLQKVLWLAQCKVRKGHMGKLSLRKAEDINVTAWEFVKNPGKTLNLKAVELVKITNW